MNRRQFRLESVGKSYGGTHAALSHVSFVINAGEHLAVLGMSGSGKSTALRLLAGLEPPSAGTILLDGQVLSAPNTLLVPPHERGIGMVFQDLALWPNLTALDNVRLGLTGTRLSRREAKARATEVLSLCGIGDLAGHQPGQLSGGQQQRVALARALAVRPSFLLLDEPFSGIDLITKMRLLAEIARLASACHITLVLVSHDPLEATALCQTAVVLESGTVQEAGPLTKLLQQPRSELLRVFRDHVAVATRIATPGEGRVAPEIAHG